MGIIVIVVMTYMPTGLMGMIDIVKKYAEKLYQKLLDKPEKPASGIKAANQ
ncbi:hypothetical protein SDC9_206738 [bioreactor metagenome]|uniref:Uncharacterized protein n=1 Tax=bioreactor metagenome TaxID=1076179 RepID=A0A645J7A6_9ZZZZ